MSLINNICISTNTYTLLLKLKGTEKDAHNIVSFSPIDIKFDLKEIVNKYKSLHCALYVTMG